VLPLFLLLTAITSSADEPGIQDNSLLTEEAYNQDPHVVQHSGLFQRDTRTHDWIYTFTQEWPAPSLTHQLSYTIPIQTGNRIGDVALNYRYQLAGNSESKFAATPRFTVMLPTGDWRRGEGNGAVGYDADIAISVAPVEHWNFHFGAGGNSLWAQRRRQLATRQSGRPLGLQLFEWIADRAGRRVSDWRRPERGRAVGDSLSELRASVLMIDYGSRPTPRASAARLM
jgi:hypothetical protein